MSDQLGVLRPRRVLVTGGGTGIGLGTVEALIQRGLEAVAVGRRKAPLQNAAQLGASICVYDVRADPDELLDQIGPIDGLVLNAGIQVRETIDMWTDTAWRDVFETNLFATARLTQAFLKNLRN